MKKKKEKLWRARIKPEGPPTHDWIADLAIWGGAGHGFEHAVEVPFVLGGNGHVVRDSVQQICREALVSHKVVLTSFCKSQFTHKSVNLLSTITNLNIKLMMLRGR